MKKHGEEECVEEVGGDNIAGIGQGGEKREGEGGGGGNVMKGVVERSE